MTSFSLCSYFVPIYGISCSNYAKLGEFEIMSREHFLRLIQDRTIREKISRLEHGDVFLGYNISKPFTDGGGELARQKAADFKKLMDFCCGRHNCIPAVNLHDVSLSSLKHMHLNCDGSVSVHEEMNNNYIPKKHSIENLIKEMKHNQSEYVWDFYSKNNKSDKEKRLINAILWLGKAQIELDNKIYFMELCFALEALLQINTNTFINPSISYSIAIRCAMIIADQFSERRMVADNLKRLYGIRSAIAHGGEKNVSNKDCEQLFGYIVYLINDLVHKKPWKEYSSMKDIVLEIDDRQLGK